jgi:hypothetical protein
MILACALLAGCAPLIMLSEAAYLHLGVLGRFHVVGSSAPSKFARLMPALRPSRVAAAACALRCGCVLQASGGQRYLQRRPVCWLPRDRARTLWSCILLSCLIHGENLSTTCFGPKKMPATNGLRVCVSCFVGAFSSLV